MLSLSDNHRKKESASKFTYSIHFVFQCVLSKRHNLSICILILLMLGIASDKVQAYKHVLSTFFRIATLWLLYKHPQQNMKSNLYHIITFYFWSSALLNIQNNRDAVLKIKFSLENESLHPLWSRFSYMWYTYRPRDFNFHWVCWFQVLDAIFPRNRLLPDKF